MSMARQPRRCLVCFAVETEAGPFRQRVRGRADLEVLVTGMGRRNAERALRRALGGALPRWVLSSGFAGGLDPVHPRGAVLFAADGAGGLGEALTRAGARAARFHCADRVCIRAAEKAALWRATGADAVEMESAAIRECCGRLGVPSATVRVISDAAGEDLPLDFNRLLTRRLRVSPVRLAWALVRRPAAVPGLMVFGRQLRVAAVGLADVLTRFMGSGPAAE
ncbi:MAG: hypothetical protein FJ387_24700 [Verrucomicrobia bacterium]|nr:hypothetical protein [Verrucomicrobiota bacterium]